MGGGGDGEQKKTSGRTGAAEGHNAASKEYGGAESGQAKQAVRGISGGCLREVDGEVDGGGAAAARAREADKIVGVGGEQAAAQAPDGRLSAAHLRCLSLPLAASRCACPSSSLPRHVFACRRPCPLQVSIHRVSCHSLRLSAIHCHILVLIHVPASIDINICVPSLRKHSLVCVLDGLELL